MRFGSVRLLTMAGVTKRLSESPVIHNGIIWHMNSDQCQIVLNILQDLPSCLENGSLVFPIDMRNSLKD